MKWIYLSPHFDDIAFSCGGLVWEQSQAGSQTSIWTVCGGDPPAGELSPFAAGLHARWQIGSKPVVQRRKEDRAACRLLGARRRQFSIPDAIYRRGAGETARYTSDETLFGPLHADEQALVETLLSELQAALPGECHLVCPLTFGGHVDHRLTRAAAEALQRPLWFYADFPYTVRNPGYQEVAPGSGWSVETFPVSPAGFEAWVQSMATYSSQISSFWPDTAGMRAELEAYWQTAGGVQLWRVRA